MSVRSRINELIDSKNLDSAVKTVEIRCKEITNSDLLSIYTLIQKLIEIKQASDALLVLTDLQRAPVYLKGSDLCSIIKNLLRSGLINQCQILIIDLIEKKFINDTQAPLVFIENATEILEFDSALKIISALTQYKIPLNERFWESVLECLTKNDAVIHSAQCLKEMTLPALKSKRIWENFFIACIRTHNIMLAISTVHDIGLVSDKSLGNEWWNLLLKKIVEDSEMPFFAICQILDKVIELQIKLHDHTLAQSLIKLVIGEEEYKIVGYVKNLKGSVTSYALSRLISQLIDMNIPREALELSNLVVQEAFGPSLTIDKLEITNEKLKWILKHQQLQMIKFMKIKKQVDDQKISLEKNYDLEDDEFVFL